MKLYTYYEGVELHRDEKIIFAKFLVPHRVLSTCRSSGGGLRDDLDYLYNHQSCEPAGHHMSAALHAAAVHRPDAYRRVVSAQHGLPPEKCATLGTAANMHDAAIAQRSYGDLDVIAICTGGVETNAGRAGDPAAYHQSGGEYEMLMPPQEPSQTPKPEHGTINTMLLISQEVTRGAMVQAVITATEAKTAALQELSAPSRYSDGLATGTGTDQIGLAARLGTPHPLTDAGKHSKLGELIGRAVHDAVRQTLALQNGLTPEYQRSVLRLLERFGATHDALRDGISAHLSAELSDLLAKNFTGVLKDPLTVAAVAALVHLRDQLVWGILPPGCLPEIMTLYGAQIAAAAAGKFARVPVYQDTLGGENMELDNPTFLTFIARALALGFSEKWTWPELTDDEETA
ncbi:MAG: adenosylcobinamide amidohydrolase [Chloroflexi bacterium]|nr:adenosylcobinamide amidohydrolase [Chloroflexota bacterium]